MPKYGCFLIFLQIYLATVLVSRAAELKADIGLICELAHSTMIFRKKKIVWIELTDIGRFALCAEEVYLLNSAYFLLPPAGMDPKFMLGILNSSTIRFYLTQIAGTSGMGTSRWINNYVKEFPIPDASVHDRKSVIRLVERVLDAKATNPDADTTALEEEIDLLVFGLYGLTAEEIAAVDRKITDSLRLTTAARAVCNGITSWAPELLSSTGREELGTHDHYDRFYDARLADDSSGVCRLDGDSSTARVEVAP